MSAKVNPPHKRTMLYIFEDSEALIKTIMKGRRPTLRHVSRTHGVALDWLFDTINMDPKIQIRYVESKNQLADILTEGNFTCDEWNHLLCLVNISLSSSQRCSQSCYQAISKRSQESDCEERVVAKSRPVRNLVSRIRAWISIVPSSTASSSAGIPDLKVTKGSRCKHRETCSHTSKFRAS